MRKLILCLIAVAILASFLMLPTAAAAPSVSLSRTALSGGKYTVTVNFANIPTNNKVEYAQILLTCRSSQHNITNNSLTMKVSGDLQVTKQFNTTADSLLVLLEPTKNSFAGVGDGAVFTFTVSQSSGSETDPGFDLAAILILKNGTEQEINQRVSASLPAAPTTQATTTKATTTKATTTKATTTKATTTKATTTKATTTKATTKPTEPPVVDPCAKGHTFRDGFCVYCAEPDPNYDPCAKGHTFEDGFCIYCGAHDPQWDPCSKGHTYRDGYCVFCLAKDPNYNPCANGHTFRGGHCIYCLAKDPNWDPHIPTSKPTTIATVPPTTIAPTAPSTIAPTAPTTIGWPTVSQSTTSVVPTVDNDIDRDRDRDDNNDSDGSPVWILIVLAVLTVGAGAAVLVLLLKKKN